MESKAFIQDEINAQLKSQLAHNAELLKNIKSEKELVEAELERTKLEIKEINLKYKEGDHKKPAMDPSGTKLHFKVSEIVKRKSKNEGDDVKLFYSISDGVDQYFNSV